MNSDERLRRASEAVPMSNEVLCEKAIRFAVNAWLDGEIAWALFWASMAGTYDRLEREERTP